MDPHGVLRGQIVNPEGHPVAGADIQAWQAGQVAAQAVSSNQGQFRLQGLRSGVYQLVTASGAQVCRVWQASVAPPAADSQLLLVQGSVVRGQMQRQFPKQNGVGTGLFGGAFTHTLSNPWVVSGLLAAGVAVPIAASNHDDDQKGS